MRRRRKDGCSPFIAYVITNLVNGRKYVGATTQRLRHRWSVHINDAKRHCLNNPLYEDIRKFGKDHFVIEHVATARTIEDMFILEASLIFQERSHISEGGYNISRAGQGRDYGSNRSIETKSKISAALKDYVRTSEHAANLGRALKGKPKTDSHKANISAALLKRGQPCEWN